MVGCLYGLRMTAKSKREMILAQIKWAESTREVNGLIPGTQATLSSHVPLYSFFPFVLFFLPEFILSFLLSSLSLSLPFSLLSILPSPLLSFSLSLCVPHFSFINNYLLSICHRSVTGLGFRDTSVH